LRSAGAEIDRAGAGVRGAIHTMSRVLPGMVEQCGGVPSAQESIRRAVIAAQFEDINGQVLAHAASRLRAVEAMVDGLASLGESVLDVLEAASVGSLDLGDIGVRLHQAVAVAQALRAPCAPAPTSAGGSVDFF
jgi:hypothetical protein